MSERTPIKPEDIRKGDTVICASNGFESKFTVDHIDTGRAYALPGNADHQPDAFMWLRESEGQAWFILDRPAPKVDLPTEPTLGWLTWDDTKHGGRMHREVGSWCLDERGWVVQSRTSADDADVTSFTPATAVPSAALDEFRQATRGVDPNSTIGVFLAAIDKAGESHA